MKVGFEVLCHSVAGKDSRQTHGPYRIGHRFDANAC